MDLKDKVAIVTGAGRGIGKAIAMALAGEGCKTVLVARSKDQLDRVAKEIQAHGGQAMSVAVDLGKAESCMEVIGKTVDEFGTVDILVNNAGVLYTTPFEEVTEKEWDFVMDVNVKSMFLLSQQALKYMKPKGQGWIINFSSTAALDVPKPLTTYGASKAAVIGLSQALYNTAKEYGVKVSIIYPGMTDTEMLREVNPPVAEEKWMKPEDMADCVLFLLKSSARMAIRDLVPWAAKHDKI